MGAQSRLRHARRLERLRESPPAVPMQSEAYQILQNLHRTIQGHCHENSRRCWEYMLEMLAHATSWQTDTYEAARLWEPMANETGWLEFFEAWNAEVAHARENGQPFSEPIGELLMHLEGANQNLGQYFTPMALVRTMNAIALHDNYVPPLPNGMPGRRGLDPSCGTGRFLIDSLIFDDGIFIHGVDLDIWMLRAAMLNVRLLSRWTSMRVLDPLDRLRPFEDAPNPDGHSTIIIGGRAIFMWGDVLQVDLGFMPNWLCAGWNWKPHPWQTSLKIAGFNGTLDDKERGREGFYSGQMGPQKLHYDFSMTDRPVR